MRTRSHSRKGGFTILELLVVIGILAVLAGLIFPAIQLVRSKVYLTQCQNNLRQIGTALTLHHNDYGVLPSNGGWDGKQKIKAKDGSTFTPTTFDKSNKSTFRWGVGEPGLTPYKQTGPWCFAILPYLEQQTTYQTQAWSEPVSTYICPSRRSAEAFDLVAQDLYGSYEGGGWKWGKTDYCANEYLIGPRPKCYRFLQITDGTSNTLMVGEKAFDPTVQTPRSWYFDEPYFLGGSAGTARRGLAVLQDSRGVDFKQNWGSSHSNSANFLFADCSVRSFNFDVTWTVMAPQLIPNDGDILPQGGD